jgi:FkbM family methyltransferase
MHAYPAAHVIAVEPVAENARMLERNLADVPESRDVEFHEVCVGARPREVEMRTEDGAWGYHMAEAPPGAKAAMKSKVMRLPDLLRDEYTSAAIDILKCDIEGAEAELFADCADWIGRVRAVVAELHGDYRIDAFLNDLNRGPARFEIANVRSNSVVTAVRC